MTGHGHTPRRPRLDGRDALQLRRLAQLSAERDTPRCGLCGKASPAPLCGRCGPLLGRERVGRTAC